MGTYVTESRRLARRHMKATNRGSTIFNDRLVDGRRSVKVWGWELPQYESFQQMLKGAGLVSEIIEMERWGNPYTHNNRVKKYRIHIREDIPNVWMDNG